MEKKDYSSGLVILNTVKNNNIGRHKLAQFLNGSKSKDVSNMIGIQGYGGLIWCHISIIEKFIDQLIGKGFLHIKIIRDYAYSYPVVELSEEGKKALEDGLPIELDIIHIINTIKIGDSERKTLELFKEGKNALEIASVRELALSTVYTHFYRLIVLGHLSSSDVVSPEHIEKIKEAYGKFSHSPSIKELKEVLPEISYEEIRCTLAELREKKKEDLNKT